MDCTNFLNAKTQNATSHLRILNTLEILVWVINIIVVYRVSTKTQMLDSRLKILVKINMALIVHCMDRMLRGKQNNQ